MRIYQVVCGIHYLNDQIEIIEEDRLYGFDQVWYTFGACDKCREELTAAEFEEIVIAHGVKLKAGELPPEMKVKKPAAASKERTPGKYIVPEGGAGCLYCPFISKTEGALAQHLRNIHGFSGIKDSYGIVCPLCKEDMHVPALHAKNRHGIQGFVALYTQAEEQGDPHGVVAEARARKPQAG